MTKGAIQAMVVAAVAVGCAVASTAVQAATPPEKYTTLCAACHGPQGEGNGVAAAALPVKPRNFKDGKYMNGKTDAQLAKVIKEGGASVGLSPLMAAFGSQLSDKEIKEIVAFIRTLAVPKYTPKK
jgi:cytochrome c553